jgi:hypothetical protein
MDAKFCLGDLLKLELHNFVDACSEIVDRAQKELIIEKALARIEEAWSRFALSFSQYQVCRRLLPLHTTSRGVGPCGHASNAPPGYDA